MINTRYVCLSDLHLGEEDSLLTDARDYSRPSPVLRALAECLAEILGRNQPGAPKPGLVLLGDVLELALCPSQQALLVFEQFLRSVMPANGELFGEIVYVPGNHDHHVWQAAREAQYLNYLARLAPADPIEPPWDTTKVVMDLAGKDRLVSGLATAGARRLPHLRDRNFEILAAYPNFGLREGGRAVAFHHGHFIEPAYRFFSTLASLFFPEQPAPQDVYTLEKENSSWIDFFWSTLGSCGRIGGDIETIYEASAEESSLRRVTDTLAASIARRYPVPKWAPRFLRECLLKAALREAAKAVSTGLERRQAEGEAPLRAEAAEGLRWYLEVLLRRQFEQEQGSAPASLAFVLGHTHKPFVDCRNGTRVLNTGGWVVDAPRVQPLHGAAAVLVSEDLSAVAVRCYNEGAFAVRVEEPLPAGAAHGAYHDAIAATLRAPAQPWKSFADTVRAEVELRYAGLAARLKRRVP
jgi:predicted phosphodiesterase